MFNIYIYDIESILENPGIHGQYIHNYLMKEYIKGRYNVERMTSW